jgi:hypothetical protein
MPSPVQDSAHVTEATGRLTSRYAQAAVTSGIVTANAQAVQDLENAVWQIMNAVVLANHPLAGGPWQILDYIGAIVGVTRDGRTDTDFLQAIKIQIRVNRSHGLAEDIIQIAALVASGAIYQEFYPAAFDVTILNTTIAVVNALLLYLGTARSAGTYGTLRYSTSSGPWIHWGSSYGGYTGAGFASTRGGAPLDQLAALGAF